MKHLKSILAFVLLCIIIVSAFIVPVSAQEVKPQPRAQICGSCGQKMVPSGGLIYSKDTSTRSWKIPCPFNDTAYHWHEHASAKQKWTCPKEGDGHGSYYIHYADGLFCGKRNSYYLF